MTARNIAISLPAAVAAAVAEDAAARGETGLGLAVRRGGAQAPARPRPGASRRVRGGAGPSHARRAPGRADALAGLTLDTGALIAAERGDRRFWSLWARAPERDAEVTVPANVLAQAYRGSQSAVIARLVDACIVEPICSCWTDSFVRRDDLDRRPRGTRVARRGSTSARVV